MDISRGKYARIRAMKEEFGKAVAQLTKSSLFSIEWNCDICQNEHKSNGISPNKCNKTSRLHRVAWFPIAADGFRFKWKRVFIVKSVWKKKMN